MWWAEHPARKRMTRNAYRILMRNCLGARPLGRLTSFKSDILMSDLKEKCVVKDGRWT
jgi:hypothetical protein